jgi:cysteine desulfurase
VDRYEADAQVSESQDAWLEREDSEGEDTMEQKESAYIYLDHNATTPVTQEAADAMRPFLEGTFGNPSSAYSLGQEAKEIVERSRQEVASLLGCAPEEIVFTSGGTESNNTVLKGLIDWRQPSACHIITTSVEHPAILNPAIFLMELGVEATILPVDGFGRLDPEAVERAIRPATRLISVMLANNETGTLQPVEAISSIAGKHGVVFHTDAAQAVGKIRVDVQELGMDFLSIAGHKLYGPKGIGVLHIRKGLEVTPLIHGAAQEGGRRAGTENMILAAGLGAACRMARERLERDVQNNRKMRDHLQDLLFQGIDDLVLNGDPERRLPNTLNVSVPGLEGAKILEGVPKVLASTGAACHDRTVRLSHVLSAMGVSDRVGMGALRFSTGRQNTMAQVEEAAHYVIEQVAKMRR